ncbi:MAG TPA: hypothetical protein VJB96_01675 [Patescibacteria group bacterium]|nr:hypothetical protein [Patescibacteria group bacterium]
MKNEWNYTNNTRMILACMMGVLFLASSGASVVASDSTPTATPKALTQATGSANLDDLKARLATKVAELRTVVKRAMYGTVKSVSVTSATVETKTKDIKIELTDDVMVTQLISGKRTTLPIEDLEAKDTITVFGAYDETLDLLKAQYIFIESPSVTARISGTVADVDREEFVVIVKTREGRMLSIDIEKATKTTVWTAGGGVVKGGFSKIAVGDTIHVIGKPVAKAENRVSATRILDLGNITGAAVSPTPTSSPEASPSATRKPTPKPSPTVLP